MTDYRNNTYTGRPDLVVSKAEEIEGLAVVARTGNWADLVGEPVLPGVATAYQGTLAETALQPTGDGSGLRNMTKAQVGLGNVDNTSDADKPVSTAVQSALDGKASTSHKASHATGGGDALTPSDIGAARTSFVDIRDYATPQDALNTGKTVVIPANVSISTPLSTKTGQEIRFINGAVLSASNTFSGDALIIVDAATSNVSDMEKVRITGNGTIDGAGYATTGIYVKFARTVKIDLTAVVHCTLYGIRVGDPLAAASSYEVTTENVTVRNVGGGSNDPSCIGIFYDNATDSVVSNNVVVGYRTGLRNNGGNITFVNNHPWTLSSYGPMVYGFYIDGTGARLISNYADSPTNLGDGAIPLVYGYYLNGYNAQLVNNSGYLASGVTTDNTAIGIYVAKSDGLYGSIIGGHFATAGSDLKWASVLGGNYALNTQIIPTPTTDGNYYTSSTGARLGALSLAVPNAASVIVTPSDGGNSRSAWWAVNSRAKFGYDGTRQVIEISDNGATKSLSVFIGGSERMRIDAATGYVTLHNTPTYASNAAAVTGGLAVGTLYRQGDFVAVVH